MTHHDDDKPDPAPSEPVANDLRAFAQLEPLAERLAYLEGEIQAHCNAEDRAVSQKARKLRKQMQEFEPGVTFIGQVKAGKTTLVNSLIGWPGLLPADVNPWTSVVTSVHLSPPSLRKGQRSSFRFFSNEEWDQLIRQGGRVGEIASRAGAANELAKVRAQLEEMREKSRQRLGRRFQLLLGQEHSYDRLDADLIRRYVCMGDNFWEDAGGQASDGQFADITKTAELWFPSRDVPMDLCIQDTPGVNDTFMIREQITINALRGSRLCVMVLSAQQALSSVDLGLIRLVSNLKSRDTIIFVNRIDELADPVREVPEIRKSITETLRKFEGPKDVEIVFGSAFWAENAVSGGLDGLGASSADALMDWAEAHVDASSVEASPREIVWELSGVPELARVIVDRIETGAAQHFVQHIEAELDNLAGSVKSLVNMRQPPNGEPVAFVMPTEELLARFDEIQAQTMSALNLRLDAALDVFDQRAHKSRLAFLDRATSALLKHLNVHGEDQVWTYDPNGLRMLLRTAYKVYATAARKAASEEANTCLQSISALLNSAVSRSDLIAEPVLPPIPAAEAPVTLAHSIALDLKGSWWGRFWRKRRGYEAFAKDFSKLIFEETAPMADTLRATCVNAYADTLRSSLTEMVEDQRAMLLSLLQAQSERPEAGQAGQGTPDAGWNVA